MTLYFLSSGLLTVSRRRLWAVALRVLVGLLIPLSGGSQTVDADQVGRLPPRPRVLAPARRERLDVMTFASRRRDKISDVAAYKPPAGGMAQGSMYDGVKVVDARGRQSASSRFTYIR